MTPGNPDSLPSDQPTSPAPQVSSASPTELISVIIVSWNRCDDLDVALASVRRQDYPNLEIIVVDNGSADGTVEMLRSGRHGPLALYRASENLGASVARNIGLRLARGSLVAFMDSDAEALEATTLTRLARRMTEEAKVGAIAPAIYLDADREDPWFLGGYYIRGLYCDRLKAQCEWRDPEFLSTCFSLWDGDLVRRLGGFDVALPYGFEDNDLSWRVQRAGRSLEVEPSLAVRHHLSSASRIRPESDAWNHFRYDERARHWIQIKKLGLWGYLKEEAWQWSAAGRKQRYYIYLNSPFARRQRLRLFAGTTLAALVATPRIVRSRNNDFIEQTAIDDSMIERIGESEHAD